MKKFPRRLQKNTQPVSVARPEKNDQYFQFVADAVPQLVFISSPKGETYNVNKRWVEYTGMSVADMNEDRWSIIHPDDRKKVKAAWLKAVKEKGTFEVEYRICNVQGIYRWFLGRSSPTYNSDKEFIGWFGTATDIDDHKRVGEIQKFLVQSSTILGSSLD